jgi:hypothetical protein
VRLADDERAARRHHFDDPGVGPSHAPLADARGDFEDIRRCLEAVLQGMPEGMWLRIQDEGILEKCVGFSRHVVGHGVASNSSRCCDDQTVTSRSGGTSSGWGPLPEGGEGGGALEAP